MVAREQKQLEQYAANISLADSYIRDGATDRAMELLLQCPEHLRHWEWGRLVFLCHQEIVSIQAHTSGARWLGAPLIESLLLDENGSRAVTKGVDGVLKLWNTSNCEMLWQVGDATNNQVSAFGFAPKGSQVAVGMMDGRLTAVDPVKGVPLWVRNPERTGTNAPAQSRRRIVAIDFDPWEDRPVYESTPNRPETIVAVAYSSDECRLVVATGDKRIRLRDSSTGAELATWQHHVPEFENLWFTPDGSQLLIKGRLAYECLDSQTGQPITTNSWSATNTARLVLDRKGRNALVFDHSGRVHRWKEGQQQLPLVDYVDTVSPRNAFFDLSGKWVCMMGKATRAGVYDVESGRLAFSISHDVSGGAFSPTSDRLVTFGPDRLIRLWEMTQGRELRVLRGHVSIPQLSTFSDDGMRIATGSREGVVKLWSAWPGRELIQSETLLQVGPYSPDAKVWATAPFLNAICIFDADSNTVVATFPTRKLNTLVMAFSPDGRYLASVGTEKFARIWDVREKRLAGLLGRHERSVWSLAWSADGRRIATGDSGGTARIWDAATRKELKVIKAQEGKLFCVQFNPTGDKLLTSGHKRPKLWEVSSGKLLHELDCQDNGSPIAVFSPDGLRIASPGVDRQIRIWDAQTGKLITQWPSRSQGAIPCSFSPAGRRFVVPVMDFSTMGLAAPFLEIWDADHGRHMVDLRGHIDVIHGSLFSPKGDRIITTSMDQTVRQWETFPWQVAAYEGAKGATLSERIQDYARTYWQQRLAAEGTSSAAWPSKALNEMYRQPSPRELEAVARPERAPNTPANLLNLDDVYTGALDCVFFVEGHGWYGDDDLSRLPRGIVTFNGVQFDVRGVVLLRVGPPAFYGHWLLYPPRVEGIRVPGTFRRLHVVHGALGGGTLWLGGPVPDQTILGRYVLHYSDGTQKELEIVYGRDLRDWYLGPRGDRQTEVTAAKLAWIGSNPIADFCESQVRVFHRIYENPRPDVDVVSVDFVSNETAAAPFVVAMTVEP